MRRINQDFASPELALFAKNLGGAVRAARVARKLSRAEFSARAQMGLSTLTRIERGDVGVNMLAWLQAFERAGILPLMAPLAQTHNDVVGESYRKEQGATRARNPQSSDHDF